MNPTEFLNPAAKDKEENKNKLSIQDFPRRDGRHPHQNQMWNRPPRPQVPALALLGIFLASVPDHIQNTRQHPSGAESRTGLGIGQTRDEQDGHETGVVLGEVGVGFLRAIEPEFGGGYGSLGGGCVGVWKVHAGGLAEGARSVRVEAADEGGCRGDG
jgi:hypothetical protein